MPSRNRIKKYVDGGYYHIYNRGVNKRTIFQDEYDYSVFLNLLKRYLNKEPAKDKQGREYESLYKRVELMAYCLLPNHFHLLIYQADAKAMTELLQRVSTAYSMYFNKKYKRIGPLFQECFKASLISSEAYLHHISRYIHLNPTNHLIWPFSSLPYYLGGQQASWVKPDRILNLFAGPKEYQNYLEDYKGLKQMLEDIQHELASS